MDLKIRIHQKSVFDLKIRIHQKLDSWKRQFLIFLLIILELEHDDAVTHCDKIQIFVHKFNFHRIFYNIEFAFFNKNEIIKFLTKSCVLPQCVKWSIIASFAFDSLKLKHLSI